MKDNLKELVIELQKKHENLTWSLSEKIWNLSEVGLIEYKSADAYREVLKENGFTVSPVKGIETAFVASYGNSSPIIGFTGEYDALPGLSQVAGLTEKKPEEGKTDGHGCGHNNLGTGALGAALIVKDYIDKIGHGTVKFFGTPSEERDGAKTFMARDGYFDDLDMALTWHPKDRNAVWTEGTLANVIMDYKFKGTSSHASDAPENGRSALDSCELMDVGVNYLREHVVEQARIHYAYQDVGGSAPNVVQAHAGLRYFYRAPKIKEALDIARRGDNIAKAAAMMCETEVEAKMIVAISDYHANKTLAKVMDEAFKELGAPEFDQEDFKLAREFYETQTEAVKEATKERLLDEFDEKDVEDMLEKGIQTKVEPLDLKRRAMTITSDVGDLSYAAPTIQLNMATAALGTSLHTWQMTAQGLTSYAKKASAKAMQVLALTAIKAMNDPEILKKAKEELVAFRGEKYQTPLKDDIIIRDPKVSK